MSGKKSRKLDAYMVLDASASMSGQEMATIEAVNGYISGLQKDHPKNRFSLVIFNTAVGIQTIVDAEKFEDVKPLTLEDYVCQGATQLLDAMGETIDRAFTNVGKRKAFYSVMTDGFENSSKEYTYDTIRERLAKAEKLGWSVAFLGANFDIVKQGVSAGVGAANAIQFDPKQMRPAMGALLTATSRNMSPGASFNAADIWEGSQSADEYLRKQKQSSD